MKPKMTREEDLTADDISGIQEKAWKETCRYTLSKSPFYREHLRKAGIRSGRIPLLKDIGCIPPVDKATLSERTEDFVCVPRDKVVDIVTTSGTTGKPLVVGLTESDMTRLAYNEYLSFRCVGLTASDSVILAVTLDRCFIAGMAYFMGLRMLGASIMRVGAAVPAMHFETIKRLQPTAIVGVPSFLRLLAAKAGEFDMDLSKATVRRAICIGEPVRKGDLSTNPSGAEIERGWNARVFSTYGNTELANGMCECEAGKGGHVHVELLHVEILDDAGNILPDGQVGELVATTFGVEGIPLIRYRTGDCCAMYHERCPCGRLTPRIGPIVGRKSQKLKVKGTTLFPATLQLVLDSTRGVAAYVIVARKESDLSDSIEIKASLTESVPAVLAILKERFQGEAKVTPVVVAVSREEIEALQMPEGSRKRRVFVDLRT